MIKLFINIVLLLISSVPLDNHFRKFKYLKVLQKKILLCAIFRPISIDIAYYILVDFLYKLSLFSLVLSGVLKDIKSVNLDIVTP